MAQLDSNSDVSLAARSDAHAASARYVGQGASWYTNRFALVLAAVFFVLNLAAVLNHAMWRDEWFVWLFIRHCPSLAALMSEIWNTGRPIGSYVIFWFVNLFGYYPNNLKIFHVLVSTGTVFLVARYSPFSRLQKVLFAFSYYTFYEFGTILRDYDISLLLVIVALVVFRAPRRRPIIFGIVLAGLFQIEVFGIIIGLALGMAYLFELWWDRESTSDRMPFRNAAIGIGIAAASLGFGVFVMQASEDTRLYILGPNPKTPFFTSLFDNIAYTCRATLPIAFQGVWNSNFLDPWPSLQFSLGLLLIILVGGFLVRRPTAMIFYVAGMAATIAFLCYLQQMANVRQLRYHGHLFTIMIVGLWLARFGRGWPAGVLQKSKLLTFWESGQSGFLTAVLGIQVVGTAIACAHEQVIPLSGARDAARIIQDNAPNLPVLADCDYAASSVCGYLDRPIFVAGRGDHGEYSGILKFDAKRRLDPLPPEELIKRINRFMASEKSDIVVLLNYGLSLNTELLGTANASVDPFEKFMVYRVRYQKQ